MCGCTMIWARSLQSASLAPKSRSNFPTISPAKWSGCGRRGSPNAGMPAGELRSDLEMKVVALGCLRGSHACRYRHSDFRGDPRMSLRASDAQLVRGGGGGRKAGVAWCGIALARGVVGCGVIGGAEIGILPNGKVCATRPRKRKRYAGEPGGARPPARILSADRSRQ